ncbi:MAG: ethanolamine utilization protein EutH [Planctomycetia bacterium]|nr:ethanolamine utilization protein EutH [Planctomycetia bacterium]
MSIIGTVVISLVLCCAVAGAIASLVDGQKGLGKEFLDGLHAIGYIFVPVAGIMAAIPLLSQLVSAVAGPVYSAIGADPAMASTTFIAVDMGGYQLARSLTDVNEMWIMAMMTGYMAGATIVFSIPMGLAMLDKQDHPYMALGVLSGVLSIPIGVFISCAVLWLASPMIRPEVSTEGDPAYQLALSLPMILINLAPLALVMVLIAVGLHFVPDRMIQGFMIFGRIMDGGIKLVVVCCIVEYFTAKLYGTGLFAWLFGAWRLAPIIADERDQLRALEVAGYIGTMLAGAFPMVYLIKKYLARPIEKLGARLGLESAGAAGLLASVANILAMFRLVRDMRPRDKVLNIAFAVCAAFLFGDHLAFTANFQPTLIVAVMLGKLGGGAAGFLLAYWLSLPKALEIEKQQLAENAVARSP